LFGRQRRRDPSGCGAFGLQRGVIREAGERIGRAEVVQRTEQERAGRAARELDRLCLAGFFVGARARD